MKQALIEALHVTLNIVTFRLYHFMQNCVDFLYIGSLVLYLQRQNGYLFVVDRMAYLLKVLLIITFSHYLYSITYILNDYINYEDDLRVKEADPDKYSFYKYRPIQYFGKTITPVLLINYIVINLTLWYFKFANVLAEYEIVMVVGLYSLLSVLESTSKHKPLRKRCIFTMQLFTKYVLLIVLITRTFCINAPFKNILEAVLCTSPYVIYRSFQHDIIRTCITKGKENKIITMSSIIAMALLVLLGSAINRSVVIAHLVISIPFAVLALLMPSLIFGVYDSTIVVLYKRSAIKLFFTLTLSSIVVLAI